MLNDPADTLIEAARERNGRDTLIARSLLWLFVMALGLPLAVGLLRGASTLIG